MNEYKKLLVVSSTLDNLEGEKIPINIIKEYLQPFRNYVDNRIKEIEENK